MSNKHNKCNRNRNDDDDANNTARNNNEAEEIEVDKQELIRQLNILDISSKGLYIIFFAVILNIRYIGWNKLKVLDALNETNYSETVEDLTYIPKVVNRLYLFTTILFLFIIYSSYLTAVSASEEERDEQVIRDTGSNLLAIVLILFGTVINYGVLNRPK
ncbi:MAG: hypothetical protein E7208_13465 [Clostridium butyricum]|nr:hypothetical protein [Clostridium butyricum]